MNQHDIEDLFAYTEWANDLVLAACAQLSAADLRTDRKISHGSILGTLTHMAGAEWVWLERWRGTSPQGTGVWAAWQPDKFADVAELRARWAKVDADRRVLLRALNDATLHAPQTFRRMDGTPTTLPMIAQMQHTVNHATMHRGQVVGMLRQLGSTPPSTDLLTYYRKQTGQ
jgi:uncharacterized damage-inducible protein DinB